MASAVAFRVARNKVSTVVENLAFNYAECDKTPATIYQTTNSLTTLCCLVCTTPGSGDEDLSFFSATTGLRSRRPKQPLHLAGKLISNKWSFEYLCLQNSKVFDCYLSK